MQHKDAGMKAELQQLRLTHQQQWQLREQMQQATIQQKERDVETKETQLKAMQLQFNRCAAEEMEVGEQMKSQIEATIQQNDKDVQTKEAEWQAAMSQQKQKQEQLKADNSHISQELRQIRENGGAQLREQRVLCDAEIQRNKDESFRKQQEEINRIQKAHETQLKNAKDEIQRHKEQHEIEKAQLEQQSQHTQNQITAWMQQTETIKQQLVSASQQLNENNSAAREEVKQKASEIQKLNARLRALQSENTHLTKTIGENSNTMQELQRHNARRHECETQLAALDHEKARLTQEVATIRDNLKEMEALRARDRTHVEDENARLRRETATDRLQLENKRLQEDAQAQAQEAAALKIELKRAHTVAKEPKKIEEFTDNEMVNILSAAFLSGCIISNLPKYILVATAPSATEVTFCAGESHIPALSFFCTSRKQKVIIMEQNLRSTVTNAYKQMSLHPALADYSYFQTGWF